MSATKVLELKRGAPKDAYVKSYWEPELRAFVQAYADAEGMTFSQAVRKLTIRGIANTSGLAVRENA